MQDLITIAAAAYPLSQFTRWDDYADKLTSWVIEGAALGADLLVFPEYAALELASLGGLAVSADLEGALLETARHRPASDALHLALAAQHGVHILGGSGPVYTGARPVNRATLYGPGGIIGHQDKQIMTRFERETWNVTPGNPLQVFTTPLGRIGIITCYDSEFPLLARALCEQGAEILLAPSCTETLAGFTRVRVGSMARALENQCVVAHAPLGRHRRLVRRGGTQPRQRQHLWPPRCRLARNRHPCPNPARSTRLGRRPNLSRPNRPNPRRWRCAVFPTLARTGRPLGQAIACQTPQPAV